MNSSVIMIIGIICALVGLVVGVLLASLRSSKPAARGAPPAAGLRQGSSQGMVGGVRIDIAPDRDGLLVEMDGKRLHSASELNTGQREKLEKLSLRLQRWLAPVSSTSVGEQAALESGANSLKGFSALPSITPTAAELARRPVVNPLNMFAKALDADIPKVTSAPQSIAAQIDAILQEKLAASPLSERGVRLMELPGKGMVVMVGLEQYNGVSEVPDPLIQDLIRASVAEWERRVEDH